MSRYLDPKADLTFKKVFGEHPDLVISFLNALLPFETEQEYITEVEYLPAEMVPDNPLRKDSIVDVRCRDGRGRQFLVEMQMIWSPEFKQRVLFNASKAYVRQMDRGKDYTMLQPVYSLNLVNDSFELDLPDEYYHYYQLVHMEHTDKVIEGLHLVFVELPKFTPQTFSEKRMHVLWLRYLTEISDKSTTVPSELMDNHEIRKAVDQLEQSAFSDEQLAAYDKFWDIVSVEQGILKNAERKGLEQGYAQGMEKGMAQGMEKGMAQGMEKGMAQGMEKGMAQGMAQGMTQGIAQGRAEERLKTAKAMKQAGLSADLIARITGLPQSEVDGL